MDDYVTAKQRTKKEPNYAGVFWIVYILLAVGGILAWLK